MTTNEGRRMGDKDSLGAMVVAAPGAAGPLPTFASLPAGPGPHRDRDRGWKCVEPKRGGVLKDKIYKI